MDLSKFVEVDPKYSQIVLEISDVLLNSSINDFIQQLQKKKLVPSNQIFHTQEGGNEIITLLLYVGSLDQVVFVYSFLKQEKNKYVVNLRRFEKANLFGRGAFGLLKNVASGKVRTLDLEIDLFRNVGKMAKGISTPSPLNKDANEWAQFHFARITTVFNSVFSV